MLNSSLDELRFQCIKLKAENTELKNKVKSLQKQIDTDLTQKNTLNSDLSDVDKIALRNQISSYINRIDRILEAE
jgi:hypothetical protein